MPFDTLRSRLHDKQAWCEIIFLHFNIKACVLNHQQQPTSVSIYSGRLYYQSPEDSFRNDYQFARYQFQDDYLGVLLHGPDGPFGTRDYQIKIQAIPVEQQSLVHLSYAVSYNLVTRMAQRVYFASAGRHRIGFSQEPDGNGELAPVRGLRGMMERNTVRFYLALEVFLDAPQPEQLDTRLRRWHQLTEQYPDQLKELDEESYLSYKAKERQHQERLQRAAGEG